MQLKVVILVTIIAVLYFAFHSFMASIWAKEWFARRLPVYMPWYRLIFNTLSLIFLIPLLLIMHHVPGETYWEWSGAGFYIANGLALLAVAGFVISTRYYDMDEFLGLKQIQNHVVSVKDMEAFHLSPFHRFVRHPWYFFLLVIIWTRDMTSTHLLIYSLITLYLVVGSWLEERKLVLYHGERYRHYRKMVPGLFPLPWKWLSNEQLQDLQKQP